jgi:hypothetical protein
MAAGHDRMNQMIDGLIEMHRGKLQASGAEFHGRVGQELRRGCPVPGLEGDQYVSGSLAYVSHESRIGRNYGAMQCILEAIGTELKESVLAAFRLSLTMHFSGLPNDPQGKRKGHFDGR